MLDEQLIWPMYERVSKVLQIFIDDPCFFPRQQDLEELNPTHDPVKRKIHKIESAWEWRNKVINAMRTSSELYLWEVPYSRRYLSRQERYFFFRYWIENEWCEECGRAITKIHRNFEKNGIYWD